MHKVAAKYGNVMKVREVISFNGRANKAFPPLPSNLTACWQFKKINIYIFYIMAAPLPLPLIIWKSIMIRETY